MTNQIEELKEKIAAMQHNLKVLEQLEVEKTGVERAYKNVYGVYPHNTDDIVWGGFQEGYEAAKYDGEDISKVLIEGDDAYIMGVKYQRVEEPKDNSKSKTIRDIIDQWWMDTFTTHSKWDAEECMDDLADQIELWNMRNKKCWLKTHHREITKYDADYVSGWMDCIETLEADTNFGGTTND